MSDNYQAVYDAVRSRMTGCNIEQAISDAMRLALSCDFGSIASREFYNALCPASEVFQQEAKNAFAFIALSSTKPSTIYRPKLMIDGNQWCALYGENLQDGVVGFGNSPEEAMSDFDAAWGKKLS